MNVINKHEYYFPLLIGELLPIGLGVHNLLGTAFAINNSIFITAGHCLPREINQYLCVGIEFDGQYIPAFVKQYEIIEELDLGIIELHKPANIKSILWKNDRVHDGTLVSASGYAYGMDSINHALFNRTFMGYTVSSKHNFRFKERKVMSYELSFVCPKGLSGAPVIEEGSGAIIGIVHGNSDVSIETGSWKEEIHGSNEVKSYITTETMKLGEAIQNRSILDEYSKILSMSIRDFLKEENKLV